MSKIIPISITTTEQTVELDATYQFAWFRNMGENDCLLSDHSGIVAGDDDVMTVKAGESGRISTSGRAVYIKAVSGTSTGEIHAQNFSDAPFKCKAKGGGQSITVEPLTVNDNGVYTAPTGKAYSPVTVDVQEEPWQPLQDGYSNFWFELTNDTLSPWLNFSAKNNDAVIDWGDGSGEVALDTLTPTHTYSKAGKYVVKVKGVTGIARQYDTNKPEYLEILRYVELNNQVTTLGQNAFYYCLGLIKMVASSVTTVGEGAIYACTLLETIQIPLISAIPQNCFRRCSNLKSISLPNAVSYGSYAVYETIGIKEITIASTVTSIGDRAIANNNALSKIHVQATTPPTLGQYMFQNLPSDYIIYVPAGTGDTYKAASGWSTYADHILEEGQTPNRMMLAKFNSENTDNEEMR